MTRAVHVMLAVAAKKKLFWLYRRGVCPECTIAGVLL